MKLFIPFFTLLLLFSPLVAKEQKAELDLKFKSISYINESIPTLSIDFISKELHKFDFIIAYANNYFEIQRSLLYEQQREHIYIGLVYKF